MDRETFEAVYGKCTKLFDLAWFQEELPQESERGQALIVAAFLEEMVERALRAFLPDHVSTKKLLNGAMAPINSFSAKSSLACSLGLITEDEYNNIETVREIRNKFAHKIDVSFGHEQIKSLTDRLNFALGALDSDPKTKPNDPKQRFQFATSALLLRLHDRCDVVQGRS